MQNILNLYTTNIKSMHIKHSFFILFYWKINKNEQKYDR